MTVARGIYLDNHATTIVDPAIAESLPQFLSNVGNASSTDHTHGQWAHSVVDEARKAIALAVRGHESGVIFTSGATEAANLVIRSVTAEKRGCVLVVSAVEHPCILETAKEAAHHAGGELRIVAVDGRGRLNMDDLATKAQGATLGCFMAANHEVGTVYPIGRIGTLLKEAGCQFLCDASQALGKTALDMHRSAIDYLIFSGHKIHALQGIGAIVCPVAKPNLRAIMSGGSQQAGYRPGTYNLPGIWSLRLAVTTAMHGRVDIVSRMAGRRDRLWELLNARCAGIVLTGEMTDRLPNNLHFCISGVENSMIIERLRGVVSVSTGAACSSGTVEPSRVLKAMRLPRELLGGAIRIGLSRFTTDDEVVTAAEVLGNAINDVRALAHPLSR